jgi:hypothetical protein
MKIKGLILLNCVLLGLAAFFFFRTRSYKGELASTEQRYQVVNDSLHYYKYTSIGDSLLIGEDYEGALEYFRKADNIFEQEDLLKEKIEMAMQVKSKSDRLRLLSNRIENIQDDKLMTERTLGEEISMRDSLMRLSNTEINILLLEAEQLKDSLARAHREMERLAESLGKVEFETANGVSVYYAGDIRNGEANGFGYGLFGTGGIYSGEWKNNYRHGEGKYIWKDGNIYVGEYKEGKRHGMGTYYFTSGEKYVGEWKENKRSGKGTLYGKEGEVVLSGRWENDQIVDAEG